MCTCCVTWWPRHTAFCWIELSRHSRALVGYVTSCVHALCLFAEAPPALHQSRGALCPHMCCLGAVAPVFFTLLFLLLLLPASCLPTLPSVLQPVRDKGPFGDTLAQVNRSSSVCPPEPITLAQPPCRSGLHRCANDLFRFFQQHFTAHPAAAASVYITSD